MGILVYTMPHTEPLNSKNGLFDGENEHHSRFVGRAGQLGNLAQAKHLQLTKEQE